MTAADPYDTHIPDPEVVADMVLPLGGPYTPEMLAAAASLVAELVRRLNHATRNPAIDHPALVDAAVGLLARAVAGMPQLCGQLATLLGRFHDTPGLYAAGPDHPDTPGDVIALARGHLGYAAHALDGAAERLGQAGNCTARLGIHNSGEKSL